MKRYLVPALVAVAAAVPAGAASALPPDKLPPPGELTLPISSAETPCGAFVLEVSDQSNGRLFTKRDGTVIVHVAGPISGTLTSLETGRSAELDFGGPAWITPDGYVLTGASLIWNPEVFVHVNGRVVAPAGQATGWTITGRQVDMCELLVD